MNLSAPEHLAVVDHLLTTTRSVRKRLDLTRPVEPEVIEQCVEIAIQAPTASNRQTWHFVVVADPGKRVRIAELYRKSFSAYLPSGARTAGAGREYAPSESQMQRVTESSMYLAEHMHEVPALVIPCIEGRVEAASVLAQASWYGSILPAVWSFMLALRARGLGAAWTTLHLAYEKEVAGILGMPESTTQAALLPVAYFKGDDFKPAERIPAHRFTHWDAWGQKRSS